MKPNDKPEYVNKFSTHPPGILNDIPTGINKTLANISSNKQVFEAAIETYKEKLVRSGHNHQMEFEAQTQTSAKNNTHKSRKPRRRRISWLKPPLSKNVDTNVEAKFLRIIDNLVPKGSE